MKLSIMGTLSNIQIIIHTMLKGKYVGTDQFGNKYYKAKPRKGYNYERRWIIYRSEVDASMVPPEWHGWLHNQTDNIPDVENNNSHYKKWIKRHMPNMSGTEKAYVPDGFKSKARPHATGDYIAWQPPK